MSSDEGRSASKPLSIGFLAERFDEVYQHAVWEGAVEEAGNMGAALVFFGGRQIGSPIGYEALDNIAFDLAKRSGMSGLVVMSNVIGTYITGEEQEAFLRRFGQVRIVTIGIEFPGLPCVQVDASGGMSAIAEHLTRVHGRRAFLFLAGPRSHDESEARKAEFLRSLAAPSLLASLGPGPGPKVEVVYGDFQEEDAYRRASAFIESGARLDAVVAANDLMAVGAMRALAEHGLDVPRQVSVTGFDDTEDSRFSLPPLTTVRQPARAIGRLAVRKVAESLGMLGAELVAAPTVSFVVRESCGCAPHARPEDLEPKAQEEEAPRGAARGAEDPLAELAADINAEIRAGRNPSRLRHRDLDPSLREAALLAVAEGESRFLASQRLAAERRSAVLGGIVSSLVSSFGVEDILRQIARGTRELGISGCWLCLFDSKDASPEWSRLLLISDAKGSRILAPFGLRFRSSELVPGGLPASRSAYVFVPLRFGEDRLGFLICTADSMDRRMYEALRDQVSSALKGAMLMTAERDRERSLERAVRARTLELSEANARLLEEAARRKGLERELLDVSNRIMGKIGQDIHDNLCQDIAGLGIMAAVLEGQLRRTAAGGEAVAEAPRVEALASDIEQFAGEAAALAKGAGETAARAKDIARGLYPAELEARGVVSAIDRLVAAARGREGCELAFEVTRGFAIKDSEKALQVYRIVQEALGNAVRHSKARRIKVGLYADRETVTAEVSDDGVGIPPGERGDQGMGLHILKYRAGILGGELRIRSSPSGTTITCRIPR
jgi:DNA-binding LacI/PurR family transcriptional regulator/signal transduction histidine kinase